MKALVLLVVLLSVVRGWATWATCPAGVPMWRHAQAELGKSALELFRFADRVVVTVLVVALLLVASWRWVEPQVAHLGSQIVGSAKAAVTPDVHVEVPGWLKKVTGR